LMAPTAADQQRWRAKRRGRSSEQRPTAQPQMRILQRRGPLLPNWWRAFTGLSDLQRVRTIEGQGISKTSKIAGQTTVLGRRWPTPSEQKERDTSFVVMPRASPSQRHGGSGTGPTTCLARSSSRYPWYEICRSRLSSVQVRQLTSATSSDFTQCTLDGFSGQPKRRSQCRRASGIPGHCRRFHHADQAPQFLVSDVGAGSASVVPAPIRVWLRMCVQATTTNSSRLRHLDSAVAGAARALGRYTWSRSAIGRQPARHLLGAWAAACSI